jgi:hypothetical protein
MAAAWLYRSDNFDNLSPAQQKIKQAEQEQYNREQNVLIVFWGALTIGVLALGLFAYGTKDPLKVFALAALVAAAAALVGSLLGFLFGLPRGGAEAPSAIVTPGALPQGGAQGQVNPTAPKEETPKRRLGVVNNNLLEISDWLTKIIIGAGLVGLKDLMRWLGAVGDGIGQAADFSGALARVFGCSIIVFFFAWGFLFVYIQTRTIISFIFAAMDRALQFEKASEAAPQQGE